jgi:deoxyxylulose-5-phosphate synthase
VCEILAGTNTKVLPISLPDQFIEHGAQSLLREKYGLSAERIFGAIKTWK